MAAFLFITLLVAAGIQITIQQTCHTKQLQDCALKLKEFADNNPLPLPRNKEELDKQCEILKDLRECTYNYSLKCVSELSRTLGNLLLLPTGEKMRDFCTPGHEINTKYINNAQCITDNYGGVTPCLKTILAVLELLPKMNWKERLPAFCCAVNHIRTCTISHFEGKCNQDVTDLIEMVIEFGITDIGTEACAAVASASECPKLPSPDTELDGSYKNNILGIILDSFIKE